MKKAAKILLLLALIASLVPAVGLYLGEDPAPYTNSEALKKIEGRGGEHFSFIVFGDNHAGLIFNDSATLKLIRHINREERFRKLPIGFVINAGDVTNRGSSWDYRVYNRVRSLIRWSVLSAVGNHDSDQGGLRLFEKYVGDREFSFGYGNSYFIFVDNRQNDFDDAQFARLEAELAKSSSCTHRFVIAHKAPLSPYQQSWFRPELSGWSYRFMKLCENYKVDIVFTGHEHMFDKGTFGGVRYITTGGGGMLIHLPHTGGGYLHYLVVRVYGDYVDYEVRRVFPPLWEYLTYYMWKDIFYLLMDIVF
jgi:predicted phosphodiesterase